MEIVKIKKPKNIALKDWRDWRWQLAHSISDVGGAKKFIDLNKKEETEINKVIKNYRLKITPYTLSLVSSDRSSAIKKQFIPAIEEIDLKRGYEDPKNEEGRLPVRCLFKLYPDRLVLYLTNNCASFCRFCLRKRRFDKFDAAISKHELKKAFHYIKNNKQIRDVLISGGDPLLVSGNLIDYVLKELRKIKHVEIIRIGTRTLSTLPFRITETLADIIKKYHPVWINTQFNHPDEITTDSARACDILLSRGIPLGNQSVLLKGVNDNVKTMKDLIHKLLYIRVRPYYLYHCHFVRGGMHFQTDINKGRDIIRKLQGHTSGFAVPRYVVSTEIGKIPITNNYIVKENKTFVELKNYKGQKIKINKNH